MMWYFFFCVWFHQPITTEPIKKKHFAQKQPAYKAAPQAIPYEIENLLQKSPEAIEIKELIEN